MLSFEDKKETETLSLSFPDTAALSVKLSYVFWPFVVYSG